MTRELLSFACYLLFGVAGVVSIWVIADSLIKAAHWCTCGRSDCGGGCKDCNPRNRS